MKKQLLVKLSGKELGPLSDSVHHVPRTKHVASSDTSALPDTVPAPVEEWLSKSSHEEEADRTPHLIRSSSSKVHPPGFKDIRG